MKEINSVKLNNRKHNGILWRLLSFYCKIIEEFFGNTFINGLKYLTFKYLNLWEKLFFLCCFIAAFYNSYYFAMNVIEKWQTSPVIISMNPEISSITQEPFPAVTVCNMNQAQHSKVKDFDTKSLDYALLQKLCVQEINYTAFAYDQTASKTDSFSKFIVKNSQSCANMIVGCKYGNSKIACSDLFRDILLDDGLCCTFNGVHPYMLFKGDYFLVRDYSTIDDPSIPVNWNPEKGYPKDLPKNFYPRLAFGAGTSNGFIIILNGDLDDYHCSSTNGAGFKVALHNPIITPNIKETGLSIQLGYQTNFRVTTLKEEADESLRTSVNVKQRQCYFSDEYPLMRYRYYSRLNCERECDARFLLKKCNCLQHQLPKIFNNVTECHVRHFDCVVEAEKNYADKELLACKKKCLPSCNELDYLAKPFFTELDNEGFAIKSPYLRNVSKESLKKYALLHIFFPSKFYTGTVKTPYIGITEFLSRVGGIMSLTIGLSVISLVEIVYFLAMKPLLHAWRNVFHKNAIHIMKLNPTDEYKNGI